MVSKCSFSDVRRYALLGDPVSHSLSPRIFQAFAKQQQSPLVYEAISVSAANLPASLAELCAEGYQGFNLTAPLKEAAIALMQDCSARARSAAALNIVTPLAGGGYFGDNSDGLGFIRDLCERKQQKLNDKRILIVGAGGALRGILADVLSKKPAQIVIQNRNLEKAAAVVAHFRAQTSVLLIAKQVEPHWQDFDFIINATSAGVRGEALALPALSLSSAVCCYDLAYGPAAAPFLSWARAAGASTVFDGLGMLVDQAAVAYERWMGQRPATDAVYEALAR